MFNAIRSLFESADTKAEFKQFLQQYHQRIERKNGVSHLGLTKCLHAVAEELGFNNFQTLDALSDKAPTKPSANTGFYLLWYVDKSVHSPACGDRLVFPTAEEAVCYLWDYVQGRIIACAMDEFIEEYEDTAEAYGFLSEDSGSELGLQDECALFMLSLNWADAIDVIDWYFAFMDDEMTYVMYELTRYHGPTDRIGTHDVLDSAYETEFDHPLLGHAGIRVSKGPIFQDEQLITISEGPELTRGLNFKTVARAMGTATRDVMDRVLKLDDMTLDVFTSSSMCDQKKVIQQATQDG